MPKNESLKVVEVIPAAPKRVYEAWLDGALHAAMTGSPAIGAGRVGEEFTAWEGYISGRNLELEPARRIVQSWRSTEFPEGAEDSRLEVLLEAIPKGTKLTLIHSNIPPGQRSSYAGGWKDFYFTPMKAYFGRATPKKKKVRAVAPSPKTAVRRRR